MMIESSDWEAFCLQSARGFRILEDLLFGRQVWGHGVRRNHEHHVEAVSQALTRCRSCALHELGVRPSNRHQQGTRMGCEPLDLVGLELAQFESLLTARCGEHRFGCRWSDPDYGPSRVGSERSG